MSMNENIFFPGPDFHVNLARLDACHPVHYTRRLLIFRCASSADRHAQLAAFKVAVRRLVARCPLLGGVMAPLPAEEAQNEDPNWRTVLPGPGLELVVRDLRAKLASFAKLEATGFPPTELPYSLLAPVPQNVGQEGPACKIQFSAIEGGTIIMFSMSHCISDGGGINELFRLLSEDTRLAHENLTQDKGIEDLSVSADAQLGLDRSVLRGMTSDIPFDIKDHPGYAQPETASSPPESPEVDSFKATGPEVPIILRISPSNLQRLKEDAQRPDAPPISTHDALSGLLWRSALLIRSRRSNIPRERLCEVTAQVFMPSDARRHVCLPPTYVGNVVYQLAASLNLATLLSSSGLGEAASAVRRAITAVTPARVASLVAKSRDMWIDWGFPGAMFTTGVAMGTNWTSHVLYRHDWGPAFGLLVRFRYPDEPFNCVLPKLPDGAAEVQASVMPEEVELLKSSECFGNYI